VKILFLANRLPHENVAGGHKLIYQRMKALQEHGHEVGLASFVDASGASHVQEIQATFEELEIVSSSRRNLMKRALHDYSSRTLPAIFWKNYSPAMMRKIGDMIERRNYDVVVAEFSEMGMYLYRNPYLSAVRKVVSCHRCLTTTFAKYVQTPGVSTSLRLKSAAQLAPLERYEFEMYSAMDHVLTLTPEDRFALINADPELRVSVIPPGIDTAYLNAAEAWKPQDEVIMMTGFFADKSNSDGAIWFARHIWPAIRQKHPNMKFLIIGAGVDQPVRQLQKQDKSIIVTGEVNDLRPYRAQARLLVNPVRLGSGLRIKVLESMAAGTPVVSTSLGVAGIPAQNGVNCFIADTPANMIQSIEWLLNDQSLSEAMSRSAKQMVQEQYSISKSTYLLEKVLHEVLSIG
jgi:polysaccharide biosynthesis protein PslH